MEIEADDIEACLLQTRVAPPAQQEIQGFQQTRLLIGAEVLHIALISRFSSYWMIRPTWRARMGEALSGGGVSSAQPANRNL